MSTLGKLRRASNYACALIERNCGFLTRRRPLYPRPYSIEPLEKRQLLSVAATINGPSSITEGHDYFLDLTASITASTYTVNSWVIDYGDGDTHTLTGAWLNDLYAWDSNDNWIDTACGPTLSHTFDITATIDETEYDTSSCGVDFSASDTLQVTVEPATPTLSIGAESTAFVGQWYEAYEDLDDGGEHGLYKFSIAWGDGSTYSDSTTPEDFTNGYADDLTHTYASQGTYEMTAVAETEQGTMTTTAAVTAAPEFYVENDDGGYTVGEAYGFTPTFSDSGQTLDRYVVSWGDSSADQIYSSSATSFNHTYASDADDPDEVTVEAIASDGTWTALTEADVAEPTLALTEDSTGTQGQECDVTAGISSGESSGASYSWEVYWGDNSDEDDIDSTPGVFSHTYSDPGTYTISVLVDGDNGGDFNDATVTIGDAAPGIGFTPTTAAFTETTNETFTDTFSNPGGYTLDNLDVQWGDGSEDAYYLDPGSEAHDYTLPGAYTATATFFTDDKSYTVRTAVDVTDIAPTLSVAWGGAAIDGVDSHFTAAYSDPGGNHTPTLYSVTWGDGSSDAYGADPNSHGTFTHTYDDAGSYTATVVAKTTDGNYTAYASGSIAAQDPIFSVEDPGYVASGQDFLAVAEFAWDNDGDVVNAYPVADHTTTYSIHWGDGSADSTSGGPDFSHAYPAYDPSSSNYYNCTISAYNDEWSTIVTNGVSVLPDGSGTVGLNAPSSAADGATVTATWSFTDPAQTSYPGAYGQYIYWGDGTDSPDVIGADISSYTAPHVYDEAGDYTMTAVATYGEPDGPGAAIAETYCAIDVGNAGPSTFTVSGDTTATVTGDTYTLSVNYVGLDNHLPQKWQIARGDGEIDQYDANNGRGSDRTEGYESDPTSFTHVYTTASTAGTTYTPELTAYIDEGSYTPSDSTSVIVAQPLMQVLEADGTPMDHNEQHSIGAFITVDDGDFGDQFDSSGNPISDIDQTSLSSPDPALVEVTLNPLPSSVGGTFTVSWGGDADFAVFADPYKDQAVTSGQTYDATSAQTLWLEGTGLTEHTGGDILNLAWSKLIVGLGSVLSVASVDSAAVNTPKITGATFVPANGQNTYKLVGITLGPDTDGWNVVGGTNNGETTDAQGIDVLWDQGAVFGIVENVMDGFAIKTPVKVFSITVAPQGPFGPGKPVGGAPAPYLNNTQATSMKGHKSPWSANVASGNPGLTFNAQVLVAGPVKAGANHPDNGGIPLLRVGFIQNVVKGGFTQIGYYTNPADPANPLQRVSSADAYFSDHGPVLDGPEGSGPSNPWYVTPDKKNVLPWQPTELLPSTTLSDDDTPANGTPADYERDVDAAVAAASIRQLIRVDMLYKFALYICAETTQNVNGAKLVYAAEAEADWQFNGSGTIGGPLRYVWTKSAGAGVTPPTGWNPVAPGTVPQTTGLIAIDVQAGAIFK